MYNKQLVRNKQVKNAVKDCTRQWRLVTSFVQISAVFLSLFLE